MIDKPPSNDPVSHARALLKRPLRILLCPDQPNWAFDHIADNIIRFAPDYLDISKYFMMSGRNRNLTRLYQVIASEQIDLVHIFWREDLFEFLRPEAMLSAAHQMGVDFTDIVEIIGTRALTTSVYDHLHLSQEALFERTTSFHLIDAYSVSSRKLQNIYASAPDLPPPDCVITDGVDLDLFYPGDQVQCERVQPVIGWVGNSKWGKHQGGDPKGYHRLFTPALEYLKNAGVPAIAKVADPQVKHIPFSEMPQFYRKIDILACTSSMEGTPNPVLEAMACGVPVVSTDVGIVPELFGPLQSRYILKNPDPEAFALSLKNILTNENEYQALCMENRERISNWSWQKRVEPWWPFWLSACEQARKPRLARRRAFALAQNCMRYMHSSDPRPRPGFANDFVRRILDIG